VNLLSQQRLTLLAQGPLRFEELQALPEKHYRVPHQDGKPSRHQENVLQCLFGLRHGASCVWLLGHCD
jgi:hypothetical protein